MPDPNPNPNASAKLGFAILAAVALGLGNIGQYLYHAAHPAVPVVVKNDPPPGPTPAPVVPPSPPPVQHVVIDNLPVFPSPPAVQHVIVDSIPEIVPPSPVTPPVTPPDPVVPNQHLLVLVVYNPSDPTSGSSVAGWKDDPTIAPAMAGLDATAMFLGSGDKAAAPLLKYVSGSTLILQTASGVAYHGPAPRAAGDLIAFIKRVRAGAKP